MPDEEIDQELESLIEETDIDDLSFVLWMICERNKLNKQDGSDE